MEDKLSRTFQTAAHAIAYNDQAGPGRLQDAVDTIFGAEKKARLAGELAPTRTACLAIIDLCFELGDWAGMTHHFGQLGLSCVCRGPSLSPVGCLGPAYCRHSPEPEYTDNFEAARTVEAGATCVQLG